jgi:hypothetical protein
MKRSMAVMCFAVLGSLNPVTASAQEAIPSQYKLVLEQKFYNLGIPTGRIDGIWDGQTQRAICTWRELTGRPISRKLPGLDEIYDVQVTKDLFTTTQHVLGLNINLSCQVAIWVRDDVKKPITIFKISSGKEGYETLPGTYKVGWSIDAWYESRTYPDGWMYRPLVFNIGQAIHGSQTEQMVHDYPASHGCVRAPKKAIDNLWKNGFGNGSIVHVYGRWVASR